MFWHAALSALELQDLKLSLGVYFIDSLDKEIICITHVFK